MEKKLFRYLALGDSTGVGIGDQRDGGYPERLFRRLKLAGINAGILNLARSGATTSEVLQGQVQKAVSTRPALITLAIGANDLWRMIPLGTFEMNLKRIADALEASDAEIVVSNLVDLTQAPIAALVDLVLRVPRALFARRVQEINDRLNALARRKRFTVVNVFSLTSRELSAHPEYFGPDGFHPSPAGYDRWAELMWPAIERVVDRWRQAQAATHDADVPSEP
jgi:acyl-CoA thioesterase I